jgi:hypothetical protein
VVGDEDRLYVDGVSALVGSAEASGTTNEVYIGAWMGDEARQIYFDCIVVANAYVGLETVVKKGGSLSGTMTEMLNSKMLFG